MFRAALVVILLVGSPVRAQDLCPGETEELAAISPAYRAAFLLERAHSVERAALTWSATWAVGYVGLTAAQLAVLTSTQEFDTRVDMAIGAIGSMIGVASIFLLPVRVIGGAPRLEGLAADAAAGDCDALAEMERIFEDIAAGEEFGRSWLMHVGNILFNLGLGLIEGIAFGLWESGMIATAIGIASGEVQILTKPSGLIDAQATYRLGLFHGGLMLTGPLP